jgi:periplasmic divalent cation tolerance protein
MMIGFVTCGTRAEARKLARALLTGKLAACVNILDGVESHYWWRGKMEQSKECLLLIKTTADQTDAVTKMVQKHHSYELPEIIFTRIAKGERRYLRWMAGAVGLLMLALPCRADPFEDLNSTNEETRVEAADRIAEMGGERAVKVFREMLESGNSERRQMAAVGLLLVSDADEDVQRIRARLQDESSVVREAAADALAQWEARIHWLRELPAALKQARELKKPVLAYFGLKEPLSRHYEEAVLADKSVVDAAQEFVCVRLNADEARKHDVRGAPTILVLDDRGNEMSRAPGLMEKEKLLAKLAETRRGKMTFLQARRQALQHPEDVPANWKVAQTYLEEGREDQAEPYLRNVIGNDEPNRYGYTDNAMFALGYALGKRGQHAQAVYCLEQLLARWPTFKDKDKALYCLGLSQLATGKKEQGRATLERLLAECPESKTIASAQNALEKLK